MTKEQYRRRHRAARIIANNVEQADDGEWDPPWPVVVVGGVLSGVALGIVLIGVLSLLAQFWP